MAPKHYRFANIWETVSPVQDQLVNTGVVLDDPGTSDPVDIADALASVFQGRLRSIVSNTVFLKELHLTSIDTTATSIIRPYTGSTAGTLSGLAPTLSACQIVTWGTGNRGPKHRGRWFLPLANSSNVANGQDGWGSAQVSAVQAAADLVLSDLITAGFPMGKMTDGSYEAFTVAIARDYIGTQRRRVNRRS